MSAQTKLNMLGLDENIAKHFPGRNALTPTIMYYGKISSKYIYEISKGPNPFNVNTSIWGLTVKDAKTFVTNSEHSDVFESLNEVHTALNELKGS